MFLYTIGFAKKSAENFFTLIDKNAINILIDVRLFNSTQLSGYARGRDLKYFLKKICDCEYEHCIEYAPTEELLNNYRNRLISWHEYARKYNELIIKRNAVDYFLKRFGHYVSVCLFSSEATPEQSHRRLLAEMIKARENNTMICHL